MHESPCKEQQPKLKSNNPDWSGLGSFFDKTRLKSVL